MPENTAQTVAEDRTERTPDHGASIMLKDVTKQYPGQARAAVGGLTLEIPRGSVVMLVGPSGCGKTTTLKMINRLIEPTEGSIVIDGEDVTSIDGNRLRRKIGYVIQAGGLFPHMTVAGNIAVVPKMLGWNKKRIAERVDELLELVSLDPEQYRDRYPKELSGGQQQRVGVARALAADPPVLIMDEPFGAVDPITRQRLQDELLNIQSELHKTIVMVTHDFDEAMKLGDWIAVFNVGGHLEQYDSPEQILAHPASPFVESFIGSGAGLKQLSLTRVRDVNLKQAVTAKPGDRASDVLSRLQSAGQDDAVVLDRRNRPIQWLSRRDLSRMQLISDQVDSALPVVSDKATLNDALDEMLTASSSHALVTTNRGAFLGTINVDSVTDAITAAREAQRSKNAPVGLNSGAMPAVDVAKALNQDERSDDLEEVLRRQDEDRPEEVRRQEAEPAHGAADGTAEGVSGGAAEAPSAERTAPARTGRHADPDASAEDITGEPDAARGPAPEGEERP